MKEELPRMTAAEGVLDELNKMCFPNQTMHPVAAHLSDVSRVKANGLSTP